MKLKQEIEIAKLDSAWKGIEKSIDTLGALVRSQPANQDPLHRFEGYKSALSLIAESYVNQVHYDRKRPEVLPYLGSIFNYGGPSPDFIYRMVHIEPGATYRVWGQRGNAAIIDFQQFVGWFGQNAEKRSSVTMTNQLFDAINTKLDVQGNFDFILSPKKHDEPWWKLESNVNTLMIREYFIDYATQDRSMRIFFDKLIDEDKETTVLNLEESNDKLNGVAYALRDYGFCFTFPEIHSRVGDNAYMELNFGSDAGAADQRYFQARFNIKPGQALIGRWKVPVGCSYWSTALYNDQYQVLSYGNRQVNLNNALAKTGKDGECYFVLSHQDPGIANWLDLDGHEQGLVLTRTKGENGQRLAGEMPALTLVSANEVLQHLPEDISMVNENEREKNLAMRRRHFHIRENR